ncbi:MULTISPECIES: rhodanese-like domain-containing protein [Loigolactobacillus]|uniref:Sulfurtransferase n=1 Tax=Loigolactobacillus backii TaxID=375175 RepID=A0A192H140_9LACO|nr:MULTISPECIES: rhodanese-like domain-containing protein [Loigolactobacillus]ANK61998.1 sulfurtransferase [Loigolactobacillus backii]ANK65385.1 sulfurtransferase [Loigolactobacillus backii]ANK67935.1 sulfurtransferase [Loigolactobacillus backii]ANK68808.1 sulfurtransferase [Loigolactobacillus backii]MDA5386806.1 rhodanese-like domain-containing protein [Loigolactobacillus backii]
MAFFTRVESISTDTLQQLLVKKPQIVDVRRPDEYEAGHIPGALNFPYEQITEYHPTTKVYLICHSGVRSKRAAKKLKGRGYDVVNVLGGMVAWNGEIKKGND